MGSKAVTSSISPSQPSLTVAKVNSPWKMSTHFLHRFRLQAHAFHSGLVARSCPNPARCDLVSSSASSNHFSNHYAERPGLLLDRLCFALQQWPSRPRNYFRYDSKLCCSLNTITSDFNGVDF